jgi:PhoH-like ATPase
MQAVGGEELGFLPGTEAEKMDPWTKAVYDVLGMFLTPREITDFKTKGAVEVIPLTHIRGRTLDNTWVVMDEAQNVSKSTLLTVLSRLGQNSKAVLTWDIAQRDNLYVGRYDGVYDVVSKMLGNKLFAHVSMQTSKRSELAQAASELLDDYK